MCTENFILIWLRNFWFNKFLNISKKYLANPFPISYILIKTIEFINLYLVLLLFRGYLHKLIRIVLLYLWIKKTAHFEEFVKKSFGNFQNTKTYCWKWYLNRVSKYHCVKILKSIFYRKFSSSSYVFLIFYRMFCITTEGI